MSPLERLAVLVERTQSLPESERLRMPSGWKKWDTGNRHRIHASRNVETGHLCHQILRLEDATDLDLEAASGEINRFATNGGKMIQIWRTPSGLFMCQIVVNMTNAVGTGDGPTMLDAQLAAAEAVLGVGR